MGPPTEGHKQTLETRLHSGRVPIDRVAEGNESKKVNNSSKKVKARTLQYKMGWEIGRG